jgi:hypothetical protein
VTNINLLYNGIGPEGAAALADALKVNTSVATINLGCNGMFEAGALADALKVNISVMDIDLSQNDIMSVSALADALKVNSTVTWIALNFGADGASALADALKVNTTVMGLDLRINGMGNDGATALINAVEVTMTVTCISFGINGISASNQAIIIQMLARNKRFGQVFLFESQQMLLSVLGADLCGVLWSYFLGSGEDEIEEPDHIGAIRADFAVVVEERRRRDHGGA